MSSVVGTRYYTPNPFEIDQNGVPGAGWRLFFYVSDTLTPLDTWSDVNLTVPNTNPVVADANGRFGSIFLTPVQAYRVQLWTPVTVANPSGTQVWDEDPVGPAAGGVVSNVAGIVGEVRAVAIPAASVPSGWLLCDGAAVSRTTYSGLFAVMGTTWGAGDGMTTFNLPDLRGRALFGKDDMGGVAALRLTSGGSGVAGNTLGATGGDQATQTHTHTVNDPSHIHNITDPGHTHVIQTVTNGGGTPIGEITGVSGAPAPNGATQSSTTGITINSADTGITIANYGTGVAQNVPPAAVINFIIYTG